MRTIHFFLDFDGTIAEADVVDLVLETFADKRWKDIEAQWAKGAIGSRECLSRQMELVRASEQELRQLVSGVKLDPHFVSFVKKAEELGVLVTIVSDGFDLFIEQVLKNNLDTKSGYLKALPIFSNRLVKNGHGFKAVFSETEVCSHGCANCKPAVIERLTSRDDNVFFVGDGLSDRFAAETAHMVFAKGKLLAYCKEKKLDCIAYDDFGKITQWLAENHAMLKKAHFGRENKDRE